MNIIFKKMEQKRCTIGRLNVPNFCYFSKTQKKLLKIVNATVFVKIAYLLHFFRFHPQKRLKRHLNV